MPNNSDYDFDVSKIKLQGVHIDLTPALQAAVYDKFSLLLRRNEWIVRINVRLNHEQNRSGRHHVYNATAQIELRGPDIVATVKGEDLYNVIDALAGTLDEQLRDRHERLKVKRNHPQPVE